MLAAYDVKLVLIVYGVDFENGMMQIRWIRGKPNYVVLFSVIIYVAHV